MTDSSQQDFADDVARWSANWATVKTLLRELGEIALAELSSFLARFVRILNPAFDRIRKARDESRCLYVARAFPLPRRYISREFLTLDGRRAVLLQYTHNVHNST